MQENEIIIVDGINENDYHELVDQSVRYALLSIPFTVNRMDISELLKRALNIAKGKLAESIFRFFCESNSIPCDLSTCQTAFWMTDKRDFLLNGYEWDIKSNLFYSDQDEENLLYAEFPALVPNKHQFDQWSKRNERKFESDGVAFLFAFQKWFTLNNSNRGSGFLEVQLSSDQRYFIQELCDQFKGLPIEQRPYKDEWFWGEMAMKGNDDYFILHGRPPLIISAYSNSDHWLLFQNRNPFKFMEGVLQTKIRNASVPIAQLPSFLSLFPHLRDSIKAGRIKQFRA